MTHDERLLLGARLRNRRNALGYTQEYVAEKVGITPRYYQMLERGEKNVSLDRLILLSRTMNVSIDFLLVGELSDTLEHPLTDIFNELSPQQKADAIKILQLYSNACKTPTEQ